MPNVSILIAYRNESLRIEPLLESLALLDFPKEKLEILMVDDHSIDDSQDKILAAVEKHQLPVRFFSLPEGKTGKKAALAMAKEQASFDFLFFTDADVILPPGWVRNMLACQQNSNAGMVCGEVVVNYKKSSFQILQVYEQAALVALSASRLLEDKPFLCNGASYMVTKKALDTIHLPEYWEKVPGGDDVMLLHAMHKAKHPIVYCRIPGTKVQTAALTDFDLVHQRIRWAGKIFLGNDMGNLIPAILVWSFHAVQLYFYFGLIHRFDNLGFHYDLLFIGALSIPLRGLWEGLLIKDFMPDSSSALNEILINKQPANAKSTTGSIMTASFLAPIYSIYVVLLGLLVLGYRRFVWKGRDYSV